jgi:hypothetical protein
MRPARLWANLTARRYRDEWLCFVMVVCEGCRGEASRSRLLPSPRTLSAGFSCKHPTRPMKGAKACRDPRGGEQRRSRATGTRRRTARSGTWPSRCDSASTSSPLRLQSFVKTTPRRAKLHPLEILRAPKVLWGGVSPLRPRPLRAERRAGPGPTGPHLWPVARLPRHRRRITPAKCSLLGKDLPTSA